MKLLVRLFLLSYFWTFVTSSSAQRPTVYNGTYELPSKSKTSSSLINFAYRLCLNSVPAHVYATAKPCNTSKPHEFKVTVLQILRGNVVVKVTRTDQASGWDALDLIITWTLYIGNGTGYEQYFIWLPYNTGNYAWNKQVTSDFCKSLDGKLVDIGNKAMYDVVYKYMESSFTSSFNDVQSWLAMTYDRNVTITQSNGQPGYNGDWVVLGGYPKAGDASWTSVGIRVGIQPHTQPHTLLGIGGMWTWPAASSGDSLAPLCAYNATH
ncbi:uncharacterized protein LOC100185512 [Ciona intestinalis]